jgi:Rieske Fe-S protein
MNEKAWRNDSSDTVEPPSGLNRRKFLKCMAWTGTGIVWTVSAGGLLAACGDLTNTPTPQTESFSFVQISDTHIGFSADGVNTDVVGTMKQTVDRINALPQRPALVIHTGDISHNSKPAEYDTASQLMSTIKTDGMYYVPGEHDVIGDKGAGFRQRFSAKTPDKTWYSFDYKGVHFIGLSNAGELDAFGLLGQEQLDWLQKDLNAVKKDTPLLIFAHVPLYSVYPQWGWETKDAGQAMAMLKPFSAVTVLNGHIHQVLSQVEGNINFYTANSTAFPQHRPGVDKPNAYKLPAGELLQDLGYRTVTIIPGKPGVDLTDTTLAGTPAATVAPGTNFPTAAPANIVSATPPAAGNPTANAAGFVDVGAEADFAATTTTPRPVMVPVAGKPAPETAFIVKSGGQYLAISDICTHQGCEVNWSGPNNRYLCPCHGSEYDIQGNNLAGPAPRPLERFKVELVNGRLMVSTQRSKA